MVEDSIEFRVRYAETDQMKYVYYGHYAQYFEMGRTELIRSLGITYKDMEETWGIMLPVRSLEVKYYKAARYDDLLRLTSTIHKPPQASIEIEHKVFRLGIDEPELLAIGKVVLVFVNKSSMRPVRTPEMFLDALRNANGKI